MSPKLKVCNYHLEVTTSITKFSLEPKPNSSTERVCGEIKLSLQYHRGALTVMVRVFTWMLTLKFVIRMTVKFYQVHHARSLPTSANGQEPNTYVKVYLKPDPTKSTKRKTKVVRKNCFPSFMETVSTINWLNNEIYYI